MGSYLEAPKTEKITSVVVTTKRLRYVTSSMQGWRSEMEDSHIAYVDEANDIYLFGVFDGHGGKEVACFVQKHFVSALLKNKFFLEKDYHNALTETFYLMDEMLRSPQCKDELMSLIDSNDLKNEIGLDDESTAGCTANVILISGNDLYTANSGDSRSAICEDGAFIELSIDHKPDNENEKDRIKKAGGDVSGGRVNGDLSVSRAMGDFEYKNDEKLKRDEQLIIVTPEITHRKITEKTEFVLMGCDGIWETKSTEKIMKLVSENLNTKKVTLNRIIGRLFDELIAKDSREKLGLDNMTGILIDLRPRVEGELSQESNEMEPEEVKRNMESEEKKINDEKNKKAREEKDKVFRKKLDDAVQRQLEERKKKCEENK